MIDFRMLSLCGTVQIDTSWGNSMRPVLVSSLSVMALLISGSAQATSPESCAGLSSRDFSKIPDAPTQIVSARMVEADGIIPQHCAVSSITAPNIGIELRIPLDDWNGKILQEGCGGSCGQALIWRADDALARGYATTTTDQGHRGGLADSKWAYNDVVAELNAGYRATYLTQVVSEVIVEQFTGKAPELSYFRGGSNGGRQAMRSAQVFPGQFDGIIAGCAPPGGDATLNGLWGMTVNFDEDDEPILTADILPRVHEAAIAACDMDDGVKDGVIGNPAQCSFKPEDLACSNGADRPCLSRKQVEVLSQIYDGPRNSAGDKLVIAGPGIGSELNWRSFVPQAANDLASQRRERRVDSLRYTSFLRDPGPNYRFDAFDWDRDPPRMRAMSPIFASVNPDLRAFKESGAKMIMYTGTHDYIPAATMTDYYDAVERVLGGLEEAQDAVRLFVIPGMNHCIGGPGAGFIDYLSYLEAWVEQGNAPDHMKGRAVNDWSQVDGGIRTSTARREILLNDTDELDSATSYTRPHYPYPQRYMYQGTGDVTDAANFQPITEQDFEPVEKTGVQGVGWYVVRADDGGPLVTFYRDVLGLGDFRSWDDGGMLWGGGTTVFEPNVLEGRAAELADDLEDAPFIPVFASLNLDATFKRMSDAGGPKRRDAVAREDETLFFKDPKGNWFGLTEPTSAPEIPATTAQQQPADDFAGLIELIQQTEDPASVAEWYASVVGLSALDPMDENGFAFDMGDGTVLRIRGGGSPQTIPADRKEITSAPVYRVYGLDDLMDRLDASGTQKVQLFDQTGGRIWYGTDPQGHLVGFQERRLPSRDLSKWTTRLPEDVVARSLWRNVQ